MLVSSDTSKRCIKQNEQYEACGVNQCNNFTCEHQQATGSCIDECNGQAAGCVCKSDFYRNDKGSCVPLSECNLIEIIVIDKNKWTFFNISGSWICSSDEVVCVC